jgi:hypothetical protein
MSALDDSDIITPAPSPFSQHAYTAEYPTRPPPAIFTAAAPHNPVGIFSPWRTNVNLPRNLFARQPQAPAPVRPHMANGIQRRPSVYRNPARENRTPDTEFQLVTQTITAPAHAHLVRRPTPFPVRSSSGLPNAAQSTRRPGAPWPVRSSSRSPIIAHTHAPQRSIELDVLPARVLADNVTVQFSDSSARDAEDNANEDVKVETNSQQGESDA